jgi:hypothetical protein
MLADTRQEQNRGKPRCNGRNYAQLHILAPPVTFGGGDADAHGAANYAGLHNSGAVRPWQVIP